MSDVTVIIPTRDEALHVVRAVQSAAPLGQVFVVDSGSTDATVALARDEGAMVVEQSWLGHAAQKNWALDNLNIRTNWVMFLDADEWVTPELASLIQHITEQAEFEAVAYHLPRKNVFMGRNLEHAWWYPDYQLRLFRRGSARYEARRVHEHMIVDGPVDYLDVPLWHENLKGVDAFLERHIRYARAEAAEMMDMSVGGGPAPGFWQAVTDAAARRRFLKVHVWSRLRHRTAVRFLWMYYVKRGYLDGPQGRVYSQLIAAYEAMVDAYLLEARRDGE
jgi:glycosyltransferase involved in cell wall biosynthesis